jgi:hypothetical protein
VILWYTSALWYFDDFGLPALLAGRGPCASAPQQSEHRPSAVAEPIQRPNSPRPSALEHHDCDGWRADCRIPTRTEAAMIGAVSVHRRSPVVSRSPDRPVGPNPAPDVGSMEGHE